MLAACSDEATFFRGKTVTIVVPYGPGGMDSYARVFAPYFQKYLAGARVAIENRPGEGGIVGKNFVYAAKPDGLTLCFATSASSLFTEWAGLPDVHYKTASFTFVGRIGAESHTLVASGRSKFSSFADILRAGGLTMGFSGLGSDDYYVALATSRLLGFRVDARPNFANVADLTFACVRGEVDAMLLSSSNLLPLIDAGTVIPLAVFHEARQSPNSEVPTIFEFVPDSQREIMRSLVAVYALDRTLLGPPGLPSARLAALRRALDQALADPELLAAMRKLKLPFNYLPGEATTNLLSSILKDESVLKSLIQVSDGATR